MHFDRELLLKHAQKRVDQEVEDKKDIIAAYLRGSLLFGSPFLGGAGDIDLVFIHSGEPEISRSIEPITAELHYDIEYHSEKVYRDPSSLRTHPWLGPTLQDAKPLHDPRHFIDYTQSGVRSNFFTPANVLLRAQKPLDQARSFWMEHQLDPPPAGAPEILAFLDAVQHAVNALALLSGPPLTTRRLGFEFQIQAEAVDTPQAYTAFLALLGGNKIDPDQIQTWLDDWEEAIATLNPTLHPEKFLAQKSDYFHKAIHALVHSERPPGALWPLLYTWTEAAAFPATHRDENAAWQNACQELGLWGNDFADRLESLDAFLDQIQGTLKAWSLGRGAELP